MDHALFKAKQTAAVYVADGLDEHTLEAFEMHMMGCTECVEDVETWRAIKVNMPRHGTPGTRAGRSRAQHAPQYPDLVGWRMAASLVVGGVVGTAGGWFGHQSQTPNLDSTQTTFFNVPAASSRRRGLYATAPCTWTPASRCCECRACRGIDRSLRRMRRSVSFRRPVTPRGCSRTEVTSSASTHRRWMAGKSSSRPTPLDGFGEPLGCVTGQVIK